MKKPYSKPQIAYVSFELSQSIAAGCEFISNHEFEKCQIVLDPDIDPVLDIFASGLCHRTPAEGSGDSLCYDIPHDDSRVFSS